MILNYPFISQKIKFCYNFAFLKDDQLKSDDRLEEKTSGSTKKS
jgi:hypothetical protein